MSKKQILDIENYKEEFEAIRNELSLLSNRFMALAMDYKHHIDRSFKEKKIYELRDNIQYRLFSANFHLELLFNHIRIVEKQIHQGMILNDKNTIPILSYVDMFRQQITSLFDSFIYHTVSVFDYLGTLTNYISSNKKEQTLMWTQLAKSVRDNSTIFGKAKYSNLIDQIDRDFVCKLYDYRADLIHRKADFGGFNVTHKLGYTESVISTFYAGDKLVKSFSELKKLSIENDLTLRFASIWILKKTINNITDILFSFKEEIESKSLGLPPDMYYLHPKTNEKLPVSVNYWHEDLYKKQK